MSLSSLAPVAAFALADNVGADNVGAGDVGADDAGAAASSGPRLDDQLCFALYAATHAITRTYRPMLGALGLTYPQYLVLLALTQHGPSTVQGIADILQLGPSTLTPLLKRLAEAGLVRRSRHPTDERVVTVSLTAKADGLRQALTDVQHEVVCRTGLDDEAFAVLRATLHALVGRLQSAEAAGAV